MTKRRMGPLWLGLALTAFAAAAEKPKAAPVPPAGPLLAPSKLKAFKARSIGPAVMGGRVSDIAFDPEDPYTFYVGLATGGLAKTSNNGGTFQAIFEKEAVASIGAVAVAPSDPKTVWVGTGEANDRNSSGWGDGVYRSTDGGETWANVGPEELAARSRASSSTRRTRTTAWVAALGDLWAPRRRARPLRDARRRQDLDAPSCRRRRPTATASAAATSSSIPPTPTRSTRRSTRASAGPGRSRRARRDRRQGPRRHLQVDRRRRDLEEAREGAARADRAASASRSPQGTRRSSTRSSRATRAAPTASTRSGASSGGVFRSEDGGETWTRTSALNPRPFYFTQIRVDPENDERVYVLGYALHVSEDGGKTFREDRFEKVHPDCHALAIDPRRPKRLLLGTDGGAYQSYDGGKSWEHLNRFAAGEFYRISLDDERPVPDLRRPPGQPELGRAEPHAHARKGS